MEDKKIQFSASGNLSEFIKNFQKEAKTMYENLNKEAKKQTDSEKDRVRFVKDQINALKEQLDLEKKITAEKLRRDKKSYERTSDSTTEAYFEQKIKDSEQKMKDFAAQSKVLGATSDMNKPMVGNNQTGSVFTGVMMAGLVRDLFHVIGQMPHAKSEFDLITPASSFTGAGIGAGVGALLGLQTAAGSVVGKEIGSFIGQALTRQLSEQQRYYGASFKVKAMTGAPSQAGSLSQFGLDLPASAQLEEQLVQSTGKRLFSGDTVRNVAGVSKAFNIDRGTILELIGTQRMRSGASEQTIIDLLNQGIKRPQLGTATQNVSALLQLTGQSSLSPDSWGAVQKVTEFNRVGGPFAANDPRSLGLISNIQNNFVNPSSSFAQAMSYATLRSRNPNASILDLNIERQRGTASHMNDMMESVAAMGGSEDFQVMQFANMAGLTGNMAAAKQLFQNRGKIGAKGDLVGITGGKTMQDILGQGSELTTSLDKSTAAVTDAFIISFTKGIEELGVRFTNRISKAIDDVVDAELGKRLHRTTASGGKNAQPRGVRSYD